MIQISTESVLAGLGALIACITFLFRALQSSQSRELKTLSESCDQRIKEKDATIEWLKNQIQTSLRTTERAATAAETATVVAKKATGES